jgi:sugar lactone lactonase YvrE
MKKITLYTLSLAAIMSVGCAKEDASKAISGDSVVFEAAFGDVESKAVLTEGASSSKVSWEQGDKVALWAGSKMYEYKADNDGAKSSLSPVGASSLADEYYALYPFDAEATLASGVITTTLPSVQNAQLESFSHHLAVSYSTSLSLGFKNVCGLFRIDITEPTITKVEFKGNAGEDVAGKIAINVGETPSWTAVAGAKTATLAAEEGDFLEVGVYYLAVLPQDFNSGVTVTFFYKDGTTDVRNVTGKVSLAASGLIGGSTGKWQIETLATGMGNNTQDLAFTADGNIWYSVRTGADVNHGIWKYNISDNTYSAIALGASNNTIKGTYPWGIGFDQNGLLYYAGKGKHKVFTCDSAGNVAEFVIKNADGSVATTSNTMKVIPDGNGNIYVLFRGAANGQGKVLKVTASDGKISKSWDLTNKQYEFMCMSYDKTKIFVFPSNSGDIQMIDLVSGTMTKIAGTGTPHTAVGAYTDGTPGNPMSATLAVCEGAVCDARGTIYFTDNTKALTVRMFYPDANGDYTKGTIKTILGTAYSAGTTDGVGLTAKLKLPTGLALAPDGKALYLLDYGTMRKITFVK